MNCQQLRVVYAGTPDFAVPALAALHDSAHELIGVYTQPDRPAGRGRKVAMSAVKTFALEAGLPVFQPLSLKDEAAQAELAALAPDIMVVAAYGLILPESVLRIPALGCINIHASLLPRWRGAAPIQRAIEAGDKETGVTIMQMAKGLDTGDMLLKKHLPIGPDSIAAGVHDALAELGAQGVLEVLPGLCEGTLKGEVQDDSQANYAAKISKEEARIDWQRPAAEIQRKIAAFNPFPVAFTELDGKALRLWRARLVSEAVSGAPGTVTVSPGKDILVATGDGTLALELLQLPGKKALDAATFLNGRDIAGRQLG
ncbi:methionyl-tRNA formyltransferase [Granulosicoccaceae sp. 1_MG-2023]|nr:methionyl-tRNA formyltransferase [Granulosicoccaceae sp. 1_MG-2023]